MISDLHIQNIAVIESADIHFSDGLNVLSGETGAGKSIIIDSINAVLGNRTSRELVRTGTDSALVTATFHTPSPLSWLEENDIPSSDELILQRKISRDGKSSCRVNGIPVTAAQLRELASQLVDIHGQNDGLHLLDDKSHLNFLDQYLPIEDLKREYQESYRTLAGIGRELKALKAKREEWERTKASYQSTAEELEKAKLTEGEYEECKARYQLLSSSEKIREHLQRVTECLTEADDSAVNQIGVARYDLMKVLNCSPVLNGSDEKISDAEFKLRDVSETIQDFLDSLGYSEEEYAKLEERISLLEHLQRKYSKDESGLIALCNSAREELQSMESAEGKSDLLLKDFAQQKEKCLALAEKLSQARKSGAKLLEQEITRELMNLNMKSTKFIVDFQTLPKLSPSGMDEVHFLMSANAGESPGRISKIASGGELSRIMLALKNVFSKTDPVDAQIFDEIDSGVSGVSAQRVGEKLFEVSRYKQVLCITHLPQIASMADSQYLVKKSEEEGRTFTSVLPLNKENRIDEIARLYGGDNVTDVTRAAAREQLTLAAAYKKGEKT